MFYQLYEQEVDDRIAKRWQALWVLRQGERLKRVREVGGSRKPIQQVLRAWKGTGVKGVIWDLAAFHKGKAVGTVPRRLAAERKVSSLVGWHYIRQALNALPS